MGAVKLQLIWFALLAMPLAIEPARACTPVPAPPMTSEEEAAHHQRYLNEWIESARSSIAIVEIRALSTSGQNVSSFLGEVTHTYRGTVRRGTIVRFQTIGYSLCGPGGMKKGERGITIIATANPRAFGGLLRPDELALLRSEGVIPPK